MSATDGTKHLKTPVIPPAELLVQKFTESRASELDSLYSTISARLNNDFKSHRNVNKAPPRHVRRRKELYKNPESGFGTSGDGTKRLRTHVWYAKRFTMTKRWGFHLPLGLHGRGRGSRALLKWLKNGTVIHDASYHSAVQLEGLQESLLVRSRRILPRLNVPHWRGNLGHWNKKPRAGALCDVVLLANLRLEQWSSVPVKQRKKNIYVLTRNLRSTAYRLAIANIVLEDQDEDLDHM
nr:ribonucleases P/MRP protein subunit POP1 [Tanacetum cinerariifolium]